VAGLHGDRLKIRIAAPALDGRANGALVALVAEALGVPKRSVRVTAGERSRDKLVTVGADCDPARLLDGGPHRIDLRPQRTDA
jgi:uncharacterized protein (TIGR00251 family)